MNQNNQMVLYYVHDPMCSWCWAFVPTWTKIKEALADRLEVRYVLGGLAPDSAQIMPKDMQTTISGSWKNIETRVPGTQFNFDFWTKCEPKRSTYPSCRAVIAARKQKPEIEREMILAIQKGYYLEARNPSDADMLIQLSGELGLDPIQFATDLASEETNKALHEEMSFGQSIGAQGFPSLVLKTPEGYGYIPLDYNDPSVVLNQLERFI
jgi:putative protein-disulfide isomerase